VRRKSSWTEPEPSAAANRLIGTISVLRVPLDRQRVHQPAIATKGGPGRIKALKLSQAD
jgi:hypothetical protein